MLASPCSLQIAVFVIGTLLLCYSLLYAYAAGGDFPVDESHQNRFLVSRGCGASHTTPSLWLGKFLQSTPLAVSAGGRPDRIVRRSATRP
jgi:hypothetical protein